MINISKDIICGIYYIENITNRKKYIGQSLNIKARWYRHKYELNNSIHDNDYLQNAWNKYGEKNFKFKILEECSEDSLNDKERYYINLFNTLNEDFGYNLKQGGQDKNYLSDYAKNKISKGNKRFYREHPESKIRKSISAINQWSDPNIKVKIMGKNNGMYGKTHSDEVKQKISNAQKGRISKYRNTNTVFCVELNKSFPDAVTACIELNLSKSRSGNIHEVCKGIRNRKTVGGYHWKYLENNI